MGRYFESREEADQIIDQATDPDGPKDEQMMIAAGQAGSTVSLLLGLRLAAQALEQEFGGGTMNEVHDMMTTTRMREPMAALKLAIAQVVEGAKDVTWNAEICQCDQCRMQDKYEQAKYN